MKVTFPDFYSLICMPQTWKSEPTHICAASHTGSSGPESHHPHGDSPHWTPIRMGTCLIHITATKANTVTFSTQNSCFSTLINPGIERWGVHYCPAWLHEESYHSIKPGIRGLLQLDKDPHPSTWPLVPLQLLCTLQVFSIRRSGGKQSSINFAGSLRTTYGSIVLF